MAVVPRKRAGGIVYGVSTSWRGRKYWELVGPNRREAEGRDALRKKQVKAGTYKPGDITDQASVAAFAAKWLDGRTNRSSENDHTLMTRHALSIEWFATMKMAEVQSGMFRKLAKEIAAKNLAEEGEKPRYLSPKSVSLVMGLVSVMFRDATLDGLYGQNPYLMPHGLLRRTGVKRFPYTVAEAAALMSFPVEERARMWNVLAFFTGARCGEICGLRWGDWDEAPDPLGALVIERQYAGDVLKTERPRIVPVHFVLARALSIWREHWALYFLRRPEPDDLIVPRLVLADIEPMTKSAAYKAWLRSCKAAGVTNRSVHSTRHTFITVARRNGADKEAVELVTHNPKGTIVDRYTTREWSELCKAVACVRYDEGDRSVDGRSVTSGITAPEPGLEPGQPSENAGQLAIVRGTRGFGTWPETRAIGEPDAGVDARQPGPVGAEPTLSPSGANGPAWRSA